MQANQGKKRWTKLNKLTGSYVIDSLSLKNTSEIMSFSSNSGQSSRKEL